MGRSGPVQQAAEIVSRNPHTRIVAPRGSCASPRYLLAMKLFAARGEIDADDIIIIIKVHHERRVAGMFVCV